MNLNIKKIGVDLSPEQAERYLEKTKETCRFLEDLCPDAEGELELGQTTRHHQRGDIYFAKMIINFPGKEFFIEKTGKDLEMAFNDSHNALAEEIRRYKEKVLAERRKAGKLKRLFKSFWPKN